MNAKQFYSEIDTLKPSKESLKRFPESFIESYIRDYTILPKNQDKIQFDECNPLLDLIYNYDVSDLCIQIISFTNSEAIEENDDYIYVGWIEAFPLAISKRTKELVEVDWSEPDTIINYVAKNQTLFLDALIELIRLNQKHMLNMINNDERSILLESLGAIAGGKKYVKFYTEL